MIAGVVCFNWHTVNGRCKGNIEKILTLYIFFLKERKGQEIMDNVLHANKSIK